MGLKIEMTRLGEFLYGHANDNWRGDLCVWLANALPYSWIVKSLERTPPTEGDD